MEILGLDFETTGTDLSRDRIIEIGYILWNVERKAPVCLGNIFVRHEPADGVSVSEFIQGLTGIFPDDLEKHGVAPSHAMETLSELMGRSSHVIAHNGNFFDKPIYEAEVGRLKWEERAKGWARPWVDTCTDVPYPDGIRTRKLAYLAAEHRIMNPFPHRAVFDVLIMMQILSMYDFSEVAALAASPAVRVRAMVSYDDREKAKVRGYRWESQMWIKDIKECRFPMECAEAGFEVVRVPAK